MTHNDDKTGDNKTGDNKTGDDKTGSGAPADFALHYLQRTNGTDAEALDALANLDPEKAATYLAHVHGPRAGEEALLRSLICERQLHRVGARFWLGTYQRIAMP